MLASAISLFYPMVTAPVSSWVTQQAWEREDRSVCDVICASRARISSRSSVAFAWIHFCELHMLTLIISLLLSDSWNHTGQFCSQTNKTHLVQHRSRFDLRCQAWPCWHWLPHEGHWRLSAARQRNSIVWTSGGFQGRSDIQHLCHASVFCSERWYVLPISDCILKLICHVCLKILVTVFEDW